MNQIILAGRITKDLELRKTQSNIAYTNITIAVPREYKDDAGEKITDFFDASLWREQAEYITKYANKGDMVGIVARLQKRKQEVNGSTQYFTDIIVSKIEILAKHNQTEQKPQEKPIQKAPTKEKPLATDEELPF